MDAEVTKIALFREKPGPEPCVVCVLQLLNPVMWTDHSLLSSSAFSQWHNTRQLAPSLGLVRCGESATCGQEGAPPRGRFRDSCRQEVGGSSERVPVKEASHIIYLLKGNSSEGERGCY